MTKIYAVIGSEGQYSDYSEWVVCAYPSKELADEHARRALALAEALFSEARASYPKYSGSQEDEAKRQVAVNAWRQAYDAWEAGFKARSRDLDPGMMWNSCHQGYRVEEVELRDLLPG